MNGCHKYVWTHFETAFIRAHWGKMMNRDIAMMLGHKLTLVRMRCYEMGLRHIELEFWTEEQVEFLREHYQRHGDTELAEMFAERWHKDKGWTKKHIEKKRRYLKLKRTSAEKDAIREGHRLNGVYAEGNKRMWATRGIAQQGDIRVWTNNAGKQYMVIKLEKGFVHYVPWLWEQVNGPVPEGMVIRVKDGNLMNATLENMQMVTWAENASISAREMSDAYVAGRIAFSDPELRRMLVADKGLIELKRQQIILNRVIYERETRADAAQVAE